MGFGLDSELSDRELADIESDLPQVFTWQGRNYPCAGNDSLTGLELGLADYTESKVADLIVRDAVLTAGIPRIGDPITFSGHAYRVESLATAEDGVSYRIRCVEATR